MLGGELRQDHQHVRLPSFEVHDTGIVVHGRDVARFVGDAGRFRQAGRDAAAILLVEQNLQHLVARILRVRLAIGDQAEKLEETIGGDLVVQPGLECSLILHAAQDVDAVDLHLVECLLDGGNADDIDQEIRGQVARLRNHPIGQLADRQRLPEVAVDVRVRVAAEVQHERLLVDDAGEAITDVDRRFEMQFPAIDLPEDAEQDGQLHRRCRVKVVIGVVGPLDGGLGVVKRDTQVLQKVFLADPQDVSIEG